MEVVVLTFFDSSGELGLGDFNDISPFGAQQNSCVQNGCVQTGCTQNSCAQNGCSQHNPCS